jgi:hypothetical protein
MIGRTTLRARQRSHGHPDRVGEVVVEVLRGSQVVATVYGSREGLHIISKHLSSGRARPFWINVAPPGASGIVVPILRPEIDECPWCGGSGHFEENSCPVCR